MSQQQTRDNSESRQRAARLIWVGMMASIGLYFLLGFMLLRETDPRNVEATEVNVLLGPLLVMSLIAVFLSFAVKKHLLVRAAEGRRPEGAQTATIVGFALAEAASILGLIAVLLTGNPFSFFIIAVGAVGMLLHFPRA